MQLLAIALCITMLQDISFSDKVLKSFLGRGLNPLPSPTSPNTPNLIMILRLLYLYTPSPPPRIENPGYASAVYRLFLSTVFQDVIQATRAICSKLSVQNCLTSPTNIIASETHTGAYSAFHKASRTAPSIYCKSATPHMFKLINGHKSRCYFFVAKVQTFILW